MTLSPRLRKAVLTTHIASSVGWLGAVVAYIGLDVTASTSENVQLVRAAYAAMDVIAFSALVPLALASVVIGVINALGTSWGLFRHYWVVMKLVLTLVATAVLLLKTPTIASLADAAGTAGDPRTLPDTLAHSIGGLLVLLVLTILSVYKPRGLTRYGWRRQERLRISEREKRAAVAS